MKLETIEKFIIAANKIHNNKYDYSEIKPDDKSPKVKIICKIHGEFEQWPSNHLKGHGCRKCSSNMVDKEEFIKRANIIHNNKYDYLNIDFKNLKVKIKIVCLEHGEFAQTPDSHLQGNGCFCCMVADRTKPLEQFIQEAKEIHNNLYDYDRVIYKNAHTKIEIKCNIHGLFMQIPDDHLFGKGCPKCAGSKAKQENEWLDSLGILEEYRQKILYIGDKQIKADAYNPITNTIYEYNGDFWHGNPKLFNATDINPRNKKTFGELYEETQTKRKLILDAGYNLVEIWGE